MVRWFAALLAGLLASTTPALAATQQCPARVVPVRTFGGAASTFDTPCLVDAYSPTGSCLNCPNATLVVHGTAYCQRYVAAPVLQYLAVPQHLVNGKCVPEYAAAPLARRAPAAVRIGAPVLGTLPAVAPPPPPKAPVHAPPPHPAPPAHPSGGRP